MPRAGCGGQLRPLKVGEQDRERAVEDDGQIPIRHLVSHQVLHAPELRLRLLGDRQLYLVAGRGERQDDRRARRRSRGHRDVGERRSHVA
jgi:hypothetical protein